MANSTAFDWWEDRVTSEIYLNTHRSDWWRACGMLAKQLLSARSLLDVGTGDGHTLWQVLSLVKEYGGCVGQVSVIEPSLAGVHRIRSRLRGVILQDDFQDTFGEVGEQLVETGQHFFDAVSVIHANYHFGKRADGTIDVARYHHELSLLPKLAREVVIMTTSSESDYYKLLDQDPFGPHAYAESVAAYYRTQGLSVQVLQAPTRFYVAHALLSMEEAKVLWQFFHDTQRHPWEDDLTRFRSRIERVIDSEGYINFKDQIITVS